MQDIFLCENICREGGRSTLGLFLFGYVVLGGATDRGAKSPLKSTAIQPLAGVRIFEAHLDQGAIHRPTVAVGGRASYCGALEALGPAQTQKLSVQRAFTGTDFLFSLWRGTLYINLKILKWNFPTFPATHSSRSTILRVILAQSKSSRRALYNDISNSKPTGAS